MVDYDEFMNAELEDNAVADLRPDWESFSKEQRMNMSIPFAIVREVREDLFDLYNLLSECNSLFEHDRYRPIFVLGRTSEGFVAPTEEDLQKAVNTEMQQQAWLKAIGDVRRTDKGICTWWDFTNDGLGFTYGRLLKKLVRQRLTDMLNTQTELLYNRFLDLQRISANYINLIKQVMLYNQKHTIKYGIKWDEQLEDMLD